MGNKKLDITCAQALGNTRAQILLFKYPDSASRSNFRSQDIWDYAQRMNDTQRQEVALIPDTSLRNFVIKSSTPPTLLMETTYNNTMKRVPYEQALVCRHSPVLPARRVDNPVNLSKLRQGNRHPSRS